MRSHEFNSSDINTDSGSDSDLGSGSGSDTDSNSDSNSNYSEAESSYTDNSDDAFATMPLPHMVHDQYLTERFFVVPALNANEITENHLTAEQLPTYLASEEGAKFMAQARAVNQRLVAWSIANGVDHTPLDYMRSTLLEFKGVNIDYNGVVLLLFNRGLQQLTCIADFIHDEKSPRSYCQLLMKKMLPAFTECGPAVYTAIMDAVFHIQAFRDLPTKLAVYRKEIAEQCALTALANLKEEVDVTWETHYVYAVLNYFHETLGIPYIEDYYIASCDQRILAKLVKAFVVEMEDKITAAVILDRMIEEVDLESWPQQLMGLDELAASQKIQTFLEQLNIYGLLPSHCDYADEGDYIEQFVLTAADGTLQRYYKLSWCAILYLRNNLAMRMQHQDYFVMPHEFKQDASIENVSLYDIYVKKAISPSITKIEPYTAFIVQQLLTITNDASYTAFCHAYKIDHNNDVAQLLDLLNGICAYLKSRQSLDHPSLHYLLQTALTILTKLYPTSNTFASMKAQLSAQQLLVFIADMHDVNPDNFNFLVHAATYGHMAVIALVKREMKHRKSAFDSLEAAILSAIINEHFAIAALLITTWKITPPTEYTYQQSYFEVFTAAISKNQLKMVKQLLSVAPAAHYPYFWRLCVYEAARLNQLEILQYLVIAAPQTGASVNYNIGYNSPLLVAAFNGHIAVIDYLLRAYQADINFTVNEHNALYRAVYNNQIAAVRRLLVLGASCNPNAHPLPEAIKQGHEAVALTLLARLKKSHVNLNDLNRYDGLLLIDAITHKQIYVLEELLEMGMNVNEMSINGVQPLMHALTQPRDPINTQMIALLLRAGANVNWGDIRHPLAIAIENQDISVVRLLMEYKINPNIYSHAESALICAVQLEHEVKVDALLDYIARYCGIDVHQKIYLYKLNPLNIAVTSNNLTIVKKLMTAGFDPHQRDLHGENAFDIARMGGCPEILAYLDTLSSNLATGPSTALPVDDASAFAVIEGSDIVFERAYEELSAKLASGTSEEVIKCINHLSISQSHLYLALAELQNEDNINNLFAFKIFSAIIEINPLYLETALAKIPKRYEAVYWLVITWLAIEYHNPPIVELMLTKDFDLNAFVFGSTPLMLAINVGSLALVKLLVESGRVDINKTLAFQEKSALCRATKYGLTEIVAYLLAKGADYSDARGIDHPLTIAFNRRHWNIFKLLIAQGVSLYDAQRYHDNFLSIMIKNLYHGKSKDKANRDANLAILDLLLECGVNPNETFSASLPSPLLVALSGPESRTSTIILTKLLHAGAIITPAAMELATTTGNEMALQVMRDFTTKKSPTLSPHRSNSMFNPKRDATHLNAENPYDHKRSRLSPEEQALSWEDFLETLPSIASFSQ